MKLKQIITTPAETDFYKISMLGVMLHQFPTYEFEWEFKCRNPDVHFTPEMIKEINEQIDAYCTTRFSKEELDWLSKIPWIKKDVIDWLGMWQPKRDEIHVNEVDQQPSRCGLSITAKGVWSHTTLYEIAILAIVNEVYFAFTYGPDAKFIECQNLTFEKFKKLENHDVYDIGTFSEFGLRRRYSGKFQDWLVGFLTEGKKSGKIPGFVGTSNVALAMKYGVKPVGTMAHELCCCVGQGDPKHNPAYSNWYMMESWIREYGTMNGIALTDTIGTSVFLKDFRTTYARLFDGVRHDSGDPFEWGNKILRHYQKLGIDPKTKTLLFSDSLDFERATKLYKAFKPYTNVAFGIGTFLSNPLPDPLNIVMKVTMCNGSPIAKISDAPGKGICKDSSYIEWLGTCIDRRMSSRD